MHPRVRHLRKHLTVRPTTNTRAYAGIYLDQEEARHALKISLVARPRTIVGTPGDTRRSFVPSGVNPPGPFMKRNKDVRGGASYGIFACVFSWNGPSLTYVVGSTPSNNHPQASRPRENRRSKSATRNTRAWYSGSTTRRGGRVSTWR